MSLEHGYLSRKAAVSVDPGRLDRHVRLQARGSVRDEVGGEEVTFIDAATVWAGRRFINGRRFYAGEGKHGEDMVVYTIRYRSDVARFWRLVHGDDVYEVVGIAELGRQHFLELTCRAIDQTPAENLIRSITASLAALFGAAVAAIKGAVTDPDSAGAAASLSAVAVKGAVTDPNDIAAAAGLAVSNPHKAQYETAALSATAAAALSGRAASNQRATSAGARRVDSAGNVRVTYQYA